MGYTAIQRHGRTYYEQTDQAAYRVRFTVWPSGRVYKRIIPANSEAEAERNMRRYMISMGRYKDGQGHSVETKRVGNRYRERE